MKKFTMFLFAGMVAMTLVACGNGGSTTAGASKDTAAAITTEANKTSGDTPVEAKYTVDAATVDPEVYPDDYPRMAKADFEIAFNKLKAANMNSELAGYKDLVDIFGVDGAYYKNCDMDYNGQLYKYYGWYAETGENVIITFKAKDKDLEYAAYVSNGIN